MKVVLNCALNKPKCDPIRTWSICYTTEPRPRMRTAQWRVTAALMLTTSHRSTLDVVSRYSVTDMEHNALLFWLNTAHFWVAMESMNGSDKYITPIFNEEVEIKALLPKRQSPSTTQGIMTHKIIFCVKISALKSSYIIANYAVLFHRSVRFSTQ